MDTPIDLHFQPTQEEVVAATRRLIWRHPLTWVLGTFIILCGCVGFFIASLGASPSAVALWLVLGLGSGLLFFRLVFVAPRARYESLRQILGPSNLTCRVTETGVEVKSDSYQARWDWKLFGHYTEERDS